MRPSIYYTCSLPLRAGGELVNFQHVNALRRRGLRAFALLDPASRVEVPSKPYAVPLLTWTQHLHFSADDWLVVPEVTPPQTFQWLARLPCRTVVHNQNPYYTFRGFPSIAAMNAFPLAGGLTCSRFTRATLRQWGSTTDWQVVHPPILPTFHRERPKRRQIAFMPRKRPEEVAGLRQLFQGLHPDLAEVPWVEIRDMSRPQVAEVLGESLVFASLGRLEGLGLPPLEAMAAGCLVCGYDGGGGQEYATPENGYWVADGDIAAFANALARALRLDRAAAGQRATAARTTASAYGQGHFEAELEAAWRRLLGDGWPAYKVETSSQAPAEGALVE
ncbi:hypothetical protein STVA_15090 [Allostella vacuolata]|nr:hypothetical protein STVA_15090 [Stella vacuolata]